MSAVSSSTVVAPPLLTAEEFVERHGHSNAELVRGVVEWESGMPQLLHGVVSANIGYHVDHHVRRADVGRVSINDSFVLVARNPDTIRGPDVAFYSWARLPRGRVHGGLHTAIPDLAVEVRSPSNTWRLIEAKIAEYLGCGVRAVLVLDPDTATAHIHRPNELKQTLHNGDMLTLPDILPGFSVALAELFV